MDERCGSQFNLSGNAVPVALCLVGNAMGILSYANILDAVVYLDGNDVLFAELDQRCHIILMRNAERHLMTSLLAVHKDCRLYVWPLQEEGDMLLLP